MSIFRNVVLMLFMILGFIASMRSSVELTPFFIKVMISNLFLALWFIHSEIRESRKEKDK